MINKHSMGIRLLFFVLILLCSSRAYAQDMEGPRVLALGGAFTAIADDSGAVRMNPAGIALKKTYTLTLSSEKTKGGHDTINATIIDSLTSELAAGLSYTREENGSTKRDFGILASAHSYKNFLAGLSVKYFSDKSTDEKDYSYDVGILLAPSKKLSMGLTGKNLEETKFAFVHKTYNAGLAYRPSSAFTASFDFTKDLDVSGDDDIYAAGLEYAIKEGAIIRGGFTDHNITDKTYYSVGFALSAPQISLDYGFRWDKDDSDNNIQAFSILVLL
ncbi:MAG: hypothetical protein IME96_01250 [Proteobacteria bacterium]|nr:hypothetical protein [Pseudomonadota bacterium]